ncbi:glycoside hydrolase family 32 protein [Kribbella sp. NPDC026611]|uniref:glycoside hydrolase family 32 protein n=1 Tax=Kribbella sp. NPDC026611 TaxID=3154911 RepID=UPI0033D75A43
MTSETAAPAADLGELAWQDPHRPRFHFVAPGGWMNDPNGVAQWGDTYHLFYQYNPDSTAHERIHWGHATSKDLVHWHDEPIALTPGDGADADADGCWSGVLVNHDGVPTVMYSGHRGGSERACIATADPTLRSWHKEPGNPVIPESPQGLDLIAYRDHCVWHEAGQWHQLIGGGIAGIGGAALHYTSPDLRHWRYDGLLHSADIDVPGELWTGTMWECIDLFPLGDSHILVFSVWDDETTHYPAYYVGDYADGKFVARSLHVLDYGLRHFYAPQSMTDVRGRRIAYGWIQEGRSGDATRQAGWSGAISLPRQLLLGADGQLLQAPVKEVASLRRDHHSVGPQTLPDRSVVPLSDVAGDQLDIELRLVVPPGATAEITVRCTSDGSEKTVIIVDRDTGELRLDRQHSSRDLDVDRKPLVGAVPIATDGRVELRVIIDHSVLEIFANGRALTARVYPTRPDAVGVAVGAVGGHIQLEQLDAWTMADIWTGPRPVRP